MKPQSIRYLCMKRPLPINCCKSGIIKESVKTFENKLYTNE